MIGPIDTHVHLFDPGRFPFASTAAYRPAAHECGSLQTLRSEMAKAGVRGAVLVAPTVGYGHDLSPVLDALAGRPTDLYGVARLTGDEGDAHLLKLAQGGIRGVRLDLRADSLAHLDFLESVAAPRRWWHLGWFVQVQADGATWARIHRRLRSWPTPLVIDHCGLPDPAEGIGQVGFRAVLGLATRPATWIKLSGPFRFSSQAWPHADTDPYAQELLIAFGLRRCLWGSDWPFVRTGLSITYQDALAHLSRWIPDAAHRQEVLCQAPAALMEACRA